MSEEPDFYLDSTESLSFETPRKCWVISELSGETRDDYLLIRIEPSVRNLQTGEHVDKVVIAGKNARTDISKLPQHVYIAVLNKEIESQDVMLDAKSITVVATGDIHPNR